VTDALVLRGPAPVRCDGRFAPSPTGALHLGNLRTALLAWLFARAGSGRFLVRIEDLDRGRVREPFVAAQLADLAALGLEHDGAVVRQSERAALYEEALGRLRERGLVYRCWCTRAEIRDAASAPHAPAGEGVYPGTCRELTRADIAAREAAGRPPALRLQGGAANETLVDRLAGPVAGPVGDLVVRRNDGAFAYNFAVVVDDHEQQMGEVVRGADLLDATPGQVGLQRLLGFTRPGYAHVPLVRDSGGRRLSKRSGDATLAGQLAAGRTPAEVRGALAASVGLARPGEAPSLDALLGRTRALLTGSVTA
jgi:glutamyl-tRNA synthetase